MNKVVSKPSSKILSFLSQHLPATERFYLEEQNPAVFEWGSIAEEKYVDFTADIPLGRRFSQQSQSPIEGVAHESSGNGDSQLGGVPRIPESCDVIIATDLLARFENALDLIERQLPHCRQFYAILVPYKEYPLALLHRTQFCETSFPKKIADFNRIYMTVIQNAEQPDSRPRLLVLYGSSVYLAQRKALQRRCEERGKWDDYYRSIVNAPPDNLVLDFSKELNRKIQELLPAGGSVLEAGCGAGWQSLALAEAGAYEVTLLDFSSLALECAQDLFHTRKLEAKFLCQDVFRGGEPEYDLVFNSGVVEHYPLDEQVQLVKAMARRSRQYVIVLAPNRLCYWYWIWRMAASAGSNWPFGKEVPLMDLAEIFRAAGLDYLGQCYLGNLWTESFLDNLAGLDTNLRERIREVHQLGIVPNNQSAYLVAGIGRVKNVPKEASSAPSFAQRELSLSGEAAAAITDALAALVSSENRLQKIQAEYEQTTQNIRILQSGLQSAQAALASRNEQSSELENRLLKYQTTEAERENEIRHLTARLEMQLCEAEGQHQALQTELADRQNESLKLHLRLQYQQESQLAQTAEIKTLNARLTDLRSIAANQVSALQAKLANQQAEINRKQQQLTEGEQQLVALRTQIDSLTKQCIRWDQFQHSRGWAMVQIFWQVRSFLLPHHSFRETIARRVWRGCHAVCAAPKRMSLRLMRKLRKITIDVEPGVHDAENRSIAEQDQMNRIESQPASSGIATVEEAISSQLPPTPADASQPAETSLSAMPDLPRCLDVVNILTPTFFNLEGEDMFCGGAERYLIELDGLIRSLGYRTAIYQCGTSSWTHWYNNLQIEGIPAGNMMLLNEEFHRRVPPGALTIYFAFHLAYPYAHTPSLGISHGIWWDHATYQYPDAQSDLYRKNVLESLRNCQHIVSVDTNTINWVRATDTQQSSKMAYIPNFVDTGIFAPRQDSGDRQNLVVLYPRRLYGPRGFWLLAELIPRICERHPHVEFHFVGKGDAAELECVNRLIQDHPGRVRNYFREPEDMHEAYRQADITLIPTVASEGTSLSCIEALASGNAVIATNVGGLPDLIIDGHNGLLVAPESEQIGIALERLIQDRELRLHLQHEAREVGKCFSKEVWKKRWLEYLARLLPPRAADVSQPSPEYCILHPQVPGIRFERMKQRPQHLFRAFAEWGHQAFFIDDRHDVAAPVSQHHSVDKLHVLSSYDELCLTNPVVYVYYAYLYRDLVRWEKKTVIYDVLDDPHIHQESDTVFGKTSENNFLHFHQKLLAEADLVLTSSQKLFESLRQERPDILLVPNAVCVDDFATGPFSRPDDIAPPPVKIIGYYGAISQWFDFALLDEAARRYPGHQFVLIGPTDVPEKLQSLLGSNPNVVHLGEKPYDQLPHYLHFFDVAIIPFVKNEITATVSPVKLFEYLAGGKPTVTTDLRECAAIPTVFIAHDANEFVAKIDEALLRSNESGFSEKLRQIAAENSWKTRARVILEGLNQLRINGKRR